MAKWRSGLYRRLAVWKEVVGKPTWEWLVVGGLWLLGAWQSIREEVIYPKLPPETQVKFTVLDISSRLPLSTWLILGLMVLIGVILEGAFRKVTALTEERDRAVGVKTEQWLCERCGLPDGTKERCFWNWSTHKWTAYLGNVKCQHCSTPAPTKKRKGCPHWTSHLFIDSRTK